MAAREMTVGLNAARAGSGPEAVARPLIVCGEQLLLDDLLRLAAAAGADATVAADAESARSAWARAPLVVVAEDELAGALALRSPRRDAVVVVCRSEPAAGLWRQAVLLGAEQVLALPAAESSLVARFADALESGPAAGSVLCCIGARGGAGASTLSAAVALAAVRTGAGSLLVDLDAAGGGIDLMLGAEEVAGLRWPDIGHAVGRMSMSALRDALPATHGVPTLSIARPAALTAPAAPIPADAVRSVLLAGRRAGCLVCADLPRAVVPASDAALGCADLVLVVVPSEVRAIAAAATLVSVLEAARGRLEVVVRGPAPSGLPAEVIAQSLGLPLAGSVRVEAGLATATESGKLAARIGRGSLGALAGCLVERLVPFPQPGPGPGAGRAARHAA